MLSLSLHYIEASDQIVDYLAKTEEKLKGDMPESVRDKIKEENKKARVSIRLDLRGGFLKKKYRRQFWDYYTFIFI